MEMPANVGRTIIFTWKATPIGGIREKGLALNGEPINITSDDDDGWRQLLEDAIAENQVNLSLSGVAKDERLMEDWFTGPAARVGTGTLTWPSGAALTGTFLLANYTSTGPYNDAETFQAELQSSGEVTYTPAASP
jgi:predicted secreted protein